MSRAAGFSLVELLVTTLLTGMMMVGVISFYAMQNRTHLQQDVITEVEQSLRGAMSLVTDAVRTSGYFGAERFNRTSPANYSSWLTIAENPTLTQGATASDPDTITVAGCYQEPLTKLSGKAEQSSLTLSVVSSSGFAANQAIVIGQIENAIITAVTGNALHIDTDPILVNRQGLSHEFPAQSPICRIDVMTFAISGGNLMRTLNGGTPTVAVNGIADLQIVPIGGNLYDITMRSAPRRDPLTGAEFTRELRSNVVISSWSAS